MPGDAVTVLPARISAAFPATSPRRARISGPTGRGGWARRAELSACAITRECAGFSNAPSPVAISMKRCRNCVSCRPSGHCTGMLNGLLRAISAARASGKRHASPARCSRQKRARPHRFRHRCGNRPGSGAAFLLIRVFPRRAALARTHPESLSPAAGDALRARRARTPSPGRIPRGREMPISPNRSTSSKSAPRRRRSSGASRRDPPREPDGRRRRARVAGHEPSRRAVAQVQVSLSIKGERSCYRYAPNVPPAHAGMTATRIGSREKGGRLPCGPCKTRLPDNFVDSRATSRAYCEGDPVHRRALPRAAEPRRRGGARGTVGVPFQPAVPPLGRRYTQAIPRRRDGRGCAECAGRQRLGAGRCACRRPSRPGRLHDLVVTLDAMTPGEMKAEGNGLVVKFGYTNCCPSAGRSAQSPIAGSCIFRIRGCRRRSGGAR